MKITTISPVTIANAKDPLKEIHQSIQPDTTTTLPIGTPEQIEATKQLAQTKPLLPLSLALAANAPTLNFNIDSGPQSLEAMKLLQEIVAKMNFPISGKTEVGPPPAAKKDSVPPNGPRGPITIEQGVKGGVVIGGVAGAGVFLLAEGLRQSTVAINNPICAAIGMVLTGVAAGAASGAAFAKFSEIGVKVSSVEVQLKTT